MIWWQRVHWPLRRCGHCQQLAPKVTALAEALKGVAKVGVINCDEQQELCSAHGIQGFPTLKAVLPGTTGRAALADYPGGRSAKEMKQWALAQLRSRVQRVASRADLQAKLLQACQPGGQPQGKGRASSALCVLLASDKSETSSLAKALSNAWAGKVAFGEVLQAGSTREAKADLWQALGGPPPDKLPAMWLVCNGDLASKQLYQVRVRVCLCVRVCGRAWGGDRLMKRAGPLLSCFSCARALMCTLLELVLQGEMRSDALQALLRQYEDGRKCAAAVPLTPATDFSKFSASVLKQLCKDHGVECKVRRRT